MASRAKTTCTVVVNRPPDEVFAYLADVNRHADWSPKAYRVEGLPDGPIGVGTSFTSYGWVPRDAEHRNEVEVSAYQPPSRIEFTGKERGEAFVSTFVLTRQAGGTKVERHLDFPKPAGAGGIVFGVLFATFIKPAVQKGMNMMKENVERSSV
jgi:uncharacterized protein YndB with AHSA1/START domain